MTGSLAPSADAHGLAMSERGHAQRTAVNQLRQVARLRCWLEVTGLAVVELNIDRLEEFLVVQRGGGRHRAGCRVRVRVMRQLPTRGFPAKLQVRAQPRSVSTRGVAKPHRRARRARPPIWAMALLSTLLGNEIE